MAQPCDQNVIQTSLHCVLYVELLHGSCSQAGQKKRFSDYMKAILKKCNIPTDQLETLAADRLTWQEACRSMAWIRSGYIGV